MNSQFRNEWRERRSWRRNETGTVSIYLLTIRLKSVFSFSNLSAFIAWSEVKTKDLSTWIIVVFEFCETKRNLYYVSILLRNGDKAKNIWCIWKRERLLDSRQYFSVQLKREIFFVYILKHVKKLQGKIFLPSKTTKQKKPQQLLCKNTELLSKDSIVALTLHFFATGLGPATI